MAKDRTPFQEIIDELERSYGRPMPPEITDPFENVAYVGTDEIGPAMLSLFCGAPRPFLPASSGKPLPVCRVI